MLAVAGAVLALAGFGGAPAALAEPVTHRQTSPSTSQPGGASPGTPVVTTKNVLVGPPTTVATTTAPATSRSSGGRVADDNRRVWLVVAGLVAVAILLALLTAWYWIRTRPSTVVAALGDAPPTPAMAPTAAEARSTSGLDEPPGDGVSNGAAVRRSERVDHAGAGRPVRPRREQREAALRRARGLTR